MSAPHARRVAASAVAALLLLLAALPAGAQGANSVVVLQSGVNRVDFVAGNGTVSAFATTPGVPLVAARAADGSAWVGTDTPTRLVQVSTAGGVTADVPLPDTPSGIAIDATGNIWIAQLNTGQLRVHSPSGAFLNSFGVGAGPRGVSVAANGAVWVASSLAGSVSRVTSGLVFTFPTGGTPFDVAARSNGEVWVSNLIGNSVQLLSAGGSVVTTIPVPLAPQGLALDEQGRLWVTSGGASSVALIPEGSNAPTVFPVGANPRGVAVDGEGRAWIACQGSNSVHRIDPRLGTNDPFPGFSQAVISGDASGLARAKIVDPNGDVDADAISNGAELSVQCNPFDPTLPELGRVTPVRASVEGGATLTIEGCGFLLVATPQLFVGSHPVTPLSVVDDFTITGTVPPGAVTGSAVETRLLDGVVELDQLPASFRFHGNPGQAWLPGSSTNDWVRAPVLADGSRGPSTPTALTFDSRSVAVDALGGIWLVEDGGNRVERRTADGVLTDSWTIPGAVLGGIAIDVDGSAWVADRGTPALPGSQVHRIVRATPGATSTIAVGTRPVAIAIGRSGDVWVSNEISDSVTRIRDHSLLVEFVVGDAPYGIAVDRRGDAWVACGDDGGLYQVDADAGVVATVVVGGQPAGVAVAGNDTIWVTQEGMAGLARVDPMTGSVTGTYPTTTAPRAIAIDGGDAVWVLHAGSGDIRRYAVNGALLDSFAIGVGGVEPGDFLGVISTYFLNASDDHDGDGVCTGAEIQHGGEPFHPTVLPTSTLYLESIQPDSGEMVGGTAITLRGCGLNSPNLTVLIGGNPVANLTVIDDATVTGTTPASLNVGPVDVVVTADAGSIIAPGSFTYRTSAVTAVACVQDGVPVTISWNEGQLYDSVILTRDGLPLVTLPGGLGGYVDANPPIGPVTYTVTGELAGEFSTPVSCTLTVTLAAPQNLVCQQDGDSLLLTWVNTDSYDNLAIMRDGFPLATLPGNAQSYADALPALGPHDYQLQALRAAETSSVLTCTATFAVLAPTALTCTPDFGSLTLLWSSEQPYGFVRIFRDGTLLIELPGNPGSHVDTTVDEGPHDYEVVGVLQGTAGPAVSCSPIVPVPAVTDLSCVAAVFDVTLAWSLPLADYDQLRVLRAGSEIAALPGNATGLTDPSLALGSYLYQIIAEKNGTPSLAAECSVDVVGPIFIRADVNADNSVDIGDPVAVLSYLFGGSAPPQCLDAADVNDDGTINVADAVYALTYLFAMGSPPPPPFPAPGPDPTGDPVDCAVSL